MTVPGMRRAVKIKPVADAVGEAAGTDCLA
jgi:hypothetical protein